MNEQLLTYGKPEDPRERVTVVLKGKQPLKKNKRNIRYPLVETKNGVVLNLSKEGTVYTADSKPSELFGMYPQLWTAPEVPTFNSHWRHNMNRFLDGLPDPIWYTQHYLPGICRSWGAPDKPNVLWMILDKYHLDNDDVCYNTVTQYSERIRS